MSRFHWTKETVGGNVIYVLRDSRSYSRAIIVKNHEGFWGQIFTRDLPDSGPYKSRKEAADWVAHILVHFELVPTDSEFGEIPDVPANKRAA